jgi:hypothetical protein
VKRRDRLTWSCGGKFNFILLSFLSLGSLLLEGYHPGVEDDAVYLSAIRRRLDPALYPHDFRWFTIQMQASIFDRMVAWWVRLTHIPVAWTELLGQCAAAFFMLWACLALSRRCFPTLAGRWAAVALVGVLLTLPVAGTALYLFDQYLHPRAIATDLVLFAVLAVLDRRGLVAALLLIAAVMMHPIMGVLGVSYCVILWIAGLRARRRINRPVPAMAAFAAAPLWIFEGPSSAWREALNTRNYYFLGRWTWYEWLGAIAPVLILWAIARYARRTNRPAMACLAGAASFYAVFQLAVACIVLLTPALVRLTPMQPMRYLHLVYLFMALLGGGLIGEKLLQGHVWRWVALFLPLGTGMFLAQRALFPATEHLELPARVSGNPWLRAFAWVRSNTPTDAYFALDPYYMQAPGEDYHSFRALAERSELADAVKDAAVATQVPDLAPLWVTQTEAVAGWQHFHKQDFLRLHAQFGVNWILVRRPVEGLDCPYTNETVAVCRLQ